MLLPSGRLSFFGTLPVPLLASTSLFLALFSPIAFA